VPYKAVDNLVDALTQLLMEMSAEQLQAVLPENIQALARVFPVLRRVSAIGKVESATANDPLMLRQQAFAALGKLLAAVGAREKLVLYIDDLQWGDIDSALLLASVLAQDPPPRMLVLLSYRSEYAGNPCLTEFRRAWESGQLEHREMEVLPLTPEESRKLASELLAGTPAAATQIERIVEQARGSAFFVQELAENARAGLDLHPVAETATNTANQPIDLDRVLWQRVQKLPVEARQLMEMIAVAGQPILIGDLMHTRAFSGSAQNAVKMLRLARLVRSTGAKLTDEIETFHDRVRESITKFLEEAASRDYHLQIAGALELNEEAAPETIASHLQSGQSPRAACFYELAGERAIHVLAFDRAEEYLKQATGLAPTAADRVRVEIRLVHFYTDTARFQDAYNTGSEAVAQFGVKLPKTFVPPLLLANMIIAFVRTGRRKPSQLIDLPEMTDERLRAVVGVISATAKAAYQVRPEICVSICTMAVNLCLKHGNTPDAAVVYMVFGCIFLGGILGRSETGYEFGRLALALIDKYQNEKQRAEVNFVVGYFGTSWMKPAVEAEFLWKVAFEEGQRTGDLFHTGCAVSGTIQGMLMRGVPLGDVSSRLEQFWPVVEQAHLREPMICLASARQLLSKLSEPAKLVDERNDGEDARLLAELASLGSRHFAHFHFLNQCMLHALTGNAAAGLKVAARSATYLADSKGLLNTPEHYFWSAMLHAMDPAAWRGATRAVAKARKKFARWANRCPANFALRHELLAAEEARLRSHNQQALEHYRRAVTLGERQRSLHLLALANQRAQLLAASMGREAAAEQFAQGAIVAYAEWGAWALLPAPQGPVEIVSSPSLS
jgi:predicted ATPase